MGIEGSVWIEYSRDEQTWDIRVNHDIDVSTTSELDITNIPDSEVIAGVHEHAKRVVRNVLQDSYSDAIHSMPDWVPYETRWDSKHQSDVILDEYWVDANHKISWTVLIKADPKIHTKHWVVLAEKDIIASVSNGVATALLQRKNWGRVHIHRQD